MLKLLENHVKNTSLGMFFFFFLIINLGNIFENFDQKVPKKWFFFCKISCFFDFFGQNFSKILPNSKIWKKKTQNKTKQNKKKKNKEQNKNKTKQKQNKKKHS